MQGPGSVGSRDLTAAESDRLQKESLYREVQDNRPQLATLVHNDLLQKLEEKLADLRDQYTETVAQYGPKFPKALRLDQEMQDLRVQIATEQDRVLARIRKDYTAAVTRERLASGAVAQQKEAVGAQNQLLVQHNILAREFESNQQLYQSLLERLKNATVSAGLQSTNIHMVDAALPPDDPIRPSKALNITLGLLAGLVLGVMTAFAQEGLDHSVKSAEEVESLLMMPALAVVPLLRASDASNWRVSGRSEANPNGRPGAPEGVAFAISCHPESTLAGSLPDVTHVRSVLFLAPNPPKSILITSSQAGEGKDRNRAQPGANAGTAQRACRDRRLRPPQRGNREDPRTRQRQGHEHAVDRRRQAGGRTSAVRSTRTCGFCHLVLFRPTRQSFVGSDRMAEICAELAKNFEHIIIDSPPVLAVTDATIMAGLVDGVVLIAESGRTHRAGLMRTRAILENSGARILGVVLNKLDMRRESYYGYGYGNYYYSQYGKYPYGRGANE